MEFRILGPLEVLEEGRPIPLDRKLTRALLAYLLLHANEPVSADRLLDELWGPTPPRTASASLQNYVSRLRKSIGPERIASGPTGYVLRVDPEQLDVAKFERLVTEAPSAAARDRVQMLRAALALWRGRPLEDLEFEEFAQEEIAQLDERRVTATEERIAAELELGDGAHIVGELEALVAEHPLRERLRALLMHALYRAGRQADALAVYQETRRVLDEELGLEPSEELRRLERQILEQDPALGPAEQVADAAPRESRRTVTVLFCDLVDSTPIAMTLDPETFRNLMRRYFEVVRAAIEDHGGAVEKFIGDAVMAVFGIPERHEDDALRAVRAALDVQNAFAAFAAEAKSEWDVEVAVRVAVNTGEVVAAADGDGPTVTGAVVNVAAQLEKRIAAGEVVLGDETYGFVRDAVSADPVDLGDGVHAWRLLDLDYGAPAHARAFATPLVGREDELRRLRNAYENAREEKKCRLVTVVGEPGIGKTRLGRELVSLVRDEARVVVGRCVSYGAGATYLPIAEIVRQVAEDGAVASLLTGEEDAAQVAQRVAEVIGAAEGPSAPGETFWAVRRLFESLARERPLVVAFDDLHWAEPTLLDLVEYLRDWADAPILVLGLARRELLESRPGWKGLLVELEPLNAEEVSTLVGELAGGPVASDVQERIIDQAGGNPLFAEQLLALASEAPDVPLDQAPPTVEALIASRLDRLAPRELDVLRRASVIGRRFQADGLDPAALSALERRGFIHRTDDGYRFHHVLVRDVAYRGIPKAERAELHEQVAENLDRRDGADEIVGYHLEQAYRYRVELARDDAHARQLATTAGDRLGRAGIRAWKRADAPATVNLLERATSLLPAEGTERLELLCELGVAIWASGDLERAEARLREAVATAAGAENRRMELRASVELTFLLLLARRDAQVEDFLTIVSAAAPVFDADGDDHSLARTWAMASYVHGGLRGRYVAASEAAEKALRHAQRSGWPPSVTLQQLAADYCYGPLPTSEAIPRCEALAASADRTGAACVSLFLGLLTAMRGDFDRARSLVHSTKLAYRDLGWTTQLASTVAPVAAEIEMLANDAPAAETILRESCETLTRMQEHVHLASQAGHLANALSAQARLDEADDWVEVARNSSMDDDFDAQITWRHAKANVLSKRGHHDEAVSLGRAASALAAQTDGLNHRAIVASDLADALQRAEKSKEATEARAEALRLFERKENLVAAQATRAALAEHVPA